MERKLYLMRHGETLFNKCHRIQGSADSPLTELGMEQARQTGAFFAREEISFDHYYCSTAERASDTVELVCEGMGIGIQPYERLKGLKEFDRGVFEGESSYFYPHWNSVAVKNLDTYFVDFGGESDSESLARMSKTLTEIMERPDHESVLAVSHGGVNALFMESTGVDPWEELQVSWPIPNCTVMEFSYDPVCEGGSGVFTYTQGFLLKEYLSKEPW